MFSEDVLHISVRIHSFGIINPQLNSRVLSHPLRALKAQHVHEFL